MSFNIINTQLNIHIILELISYLRRTNQVMDLEFIYTLTLYFDFGVHIDFIPGKALRILNFMW